MAKPKRQVNFYTDKETWLEFSKKCLELEKSKSAILNELIKKFLGKKK